MISSLLMIKVIYQLIPQAGFKRFECKLSDDRHLPQLDRSLDFTADRRSIQESLLSCLGLGRDLKSSVVSVPVKMLYSLWLNPVRYRVIFWSPTSKETIF